jgi:hypothetical protein
VISEPEPEIIQQWRQGRARLLAQLSRGDENVSSIRMAQAYARLSSEQRRELQPLLDEWILSDKPGERFDAQGIIDDNRVVASLPALRQLAGRLEQSDSVQDLYEWKLVNRIIGTLTEPTHLE